MAEKAATKRRPVDQVSMERGQMIRRHDSIAAAVLAANVDAPRMCKIIKDGKELRGSSWHDANTHGDDGGGVKGAESAESGSRSVTKRKKTDTGKEEEASEAQVGGGRRAIAMALMTCYLLLSSSK